MIDKLVQWLEQMKAQNIKKYDLREKISYADMVVVCTAKNENHAKAIAQHLMDESKQAGISLYNKEGLGSKWVLLDYSEAIVHIFLEETRKYYDLENFWSGSND